METEINIVEIIEIISEVAEAEDEAEEGTLIPAAEATEITAKVNGKQRSG